MTDERPPHVEPEDVPPHVLESIALRAKAVRTLSYSMGGDNWLRVLEECLAHYYREGASSHVDSPHVSARHFDWTCPECERNLMTSEHSCLCPEPERYAASQSPHVEDDV